VACSASLDLEAALSLSALSLAALSLSARCWLAACWLFRCWLARCWLARCWLFRCWLARCSPIESDRSSVGSTGGLVLEVYDVSEKKSKLPLCSSYLDLGTLSGANIDHDGQVPMLDAGGATIGKLVCGACRADRNP
jgi:hypothetical protein